MKFVSQNRSLDCDTFLVRLLEAQETERRNLSRVLHDELGQLVTAIRLDLGSLERKQSDSEANSLLQRAIEETDQLLRSLHEIASRARPSVLDDLGLKDAIESFVSEYQRRTGVSVTAHLLFEQDKIPTRIGENAYRIVSEALSNVATHAEAGEAERYNGSATTTCSASRSKTLVWVSMRRSRSFDSTWYPRDEGTRRTTGR